MERNIILIRLLDKYEKSKHLLEPGRSNRRVMLRIEKNELPEYKHETANIRDAFNRTARELEQEHLISIEWLKGRPVISGIILNLDQVNRCYQMTGRTHPRQQAEVVAQMVQGALEGIETPWIACSANSLRCGRSAAGAITTARPLNGRYGIPSFVSLRNITQG